MGRNVHVCVAE